MRGMLYLCMLIKVLDTRLSQKFLLAVGEIAMIIRV